MPVKCALVLSGGGARAAYQVGVLAAVADQYPDVSFRIKTGVSAGAINTAFLAAHPGQFSEGINALKVEWNGLLTEHVFRFRSTGIVPAAFRGAIHFLSGKREGPPALRGLLDMSPLRRFLSACIDFDGIEKNIARGSLDAVALSATSYSTGVTQTFVQGAPESPMWRRARRFSTRTPITIDHVIASSAIPLFFAAVPLGNEYYGDGSLRQTAPLAPAIHLGADSILAISMRSDSEIPVVEGAGVYPSSSQIAGVLFNSIFLDALDSDAERLQRINRVLEEIGDGGGPPEGLRCIKLLTLRPSRDLGDMAAGRKVDFPWWLSLALRAMGGNRRQSSDFLSYLMFDPRYTGTLMELGFEDGRNNRDELEKFFAENSP